MWRRQSAEAAIVGLPVGNRAQHIRAIEIDLSVRKVLLLTFWFSRSFPGLYWQRDREIARTSLCCITGHGIAGAEHAITSRQKEFLHETARFDTARLVVIAFCCRSGAMTEQTGRDPDMRRVVDRDAGRDAIPK